MTSSWRKYPRCAGPASSLAVFATLAGLSNVLDHRTTTSAEKTAEPAENRPPYASARQASSKRFDGVYSSVSPVHDAARCPWYGCPHLPRDIVFDGEANTALQNVRDLYPIGGVTGGAGAADGSADGSLKLLRSIGNNDCATLTLTGYKGGRMESQINQDRSFVISPFMDTGTNKNRDTVRLEGDDNPSLHNRHSRRRLLGVFDGHGDGGEFISDHAVIKIPSLIASKITKMLADENRDETTTDDDAAVQKIIFDSFLETDRTAPSSSFIVGGCTATVVLQLGSRIYIGNAGDSRSLVATYRRSTGEVSIVYISREDKPDLPDERKRVERMGGKVQLPPYQGGTARVIYMDPEGMREYGLAMSRSIGDWDAGKVGVIPDPIVDVLRLEDLTSLSEDGDIEVFAVSATDGLLDFVSVRTVVNHVAKGLYATDGDESPHLITACEELIGHAAKGWYKAKLGRYRDDIAIAVSRLT